MYGRVMKWSWVMDGKSINNIRRVSMETNVNGRRRDSMERNSNGGGRDIMEGKAKDGKEVQTDEDGDGDSESGEEEESEEDEEEEEDDPDRGTTCRIKRQDPPKTEGGGLPPGEWVSKHDTGSRWTNIMEVLFPPAIFPPSAVATDKKEQ